jgi:large subunit ribosomal protein L1
MSKLSKRFKEVKAKVNKEQLYSLNEAVKLIKETSKVKFDASVEVHIHLGIDPQKGEQVVRGSVNFPHGTGKTIKVAAFVTPQKEKEAKEAGAEVVGGKLLIEQIKKDGKVDFDIAIAEPAIMKELAPIAKTLGQKGLMPNPKSGTVTADIKKTIEELRKGKANFKNDDTGNLHLMVGKVSFTEAQLKENILAFLEAVKKAKPEGIKGIYLKSVTICSTMGPGIKV